mmetsp:Transcript_175964/g.564248  ORF Transcript_175964/g.564248 Transcript_175964/m.564248 type:complete len:244 (-) Transcript_175964:1576-2307(-)
MVQLTNVTQHKRTDLLHAEVEHHQGGDVLQPEFGNESRERDVAHAQHELAHLCRSGCRMILVHGNIQDAPGLNKLIYPRASIDVRGGAEDVEAQGTLPVREHGLQRQGVLPPPKYQHHVCCFVLPSSRGRSIQCRSHRELCAFALGLEQLEERESPRRHRPLQPDALQVRAELKCLGVQPSQCELSIRTRVSVRSQLCNTQSLLYRQGAEQAQDLNGLIDLERQREYAAIHGHHQLAAGKPAH